MDGHPQAMHVRKSGGDVMLMVGSLPRCGYYPGCQIETLEAVYTICRFTSRIGGKMADGPWLAALLLVVPPIAWSAPTDRDIRRHRPVAGVPLLTAVTCATHEATAGYD